MNIRQAFKELVSSNELDSSTIIKTLNELTKKLNSVYYDSTSETSHRVYAGSFGRGTANNYSDIDYCFVLPLDVYKRFQDRKGNIQSQLIAEIKEKLKERYPRTEIKGDGQVVDVNFKKRQVELVPSFKLNIYSDELTYPDTHNDGSWRKTNPINQHKEVEEVSTKFPLYKFVCKVLRCWKYSNDVKIKGIVIDCLVKEFFNNHFTYFKKTINDIDIVELMKDIFNYLYNNAPSSVFIIGENEIIDTENEKFQRKAKKAYKKMSEPDPYQLWDNCINLFGAGFPDNGISQNKEDYIYNIFPIKLKYNVQIDCDIIADGFRSLSLANLLNNSLYSFIVDKSRKLRFKITSCDVPQPYKIYWKVRNIGAEAIKRNMIRGKIFEGGPVQEEHSDFHGSHYVECYIVKDGICVAKDKIDVPIK